MSLSTEEDAFPMFINPTPLGNNFLRFDFFTPHFCEYIIAAAEGQEWGSNKKDRYKTQDVYLEDAIPGLYEGINLQLEHRIWPAVVDYWDIDEVNTETIFVVKYSMDSQTSLELHHDESFISGSVKLNDKYEGGLLEFPRQKFTNEDIKVGQLICWPGKITHPHKSTDITQGTKYAMTIWTKDYE